MPPGSWPAGADLASGADLARQRDIVDAFRAASREGDLDRLLALLDPEAVVRSDATAVGLGSAPEMRGAPAVAAFFTFVFTRDRIAGIDVVADPAHLEEQ